MADRITVTFAARYGLDLEGLADEKAGLPDGVTAVVRVTPPPAFKAAGPDEWRSIVQVIVDVGGVVGVGLLTNWLYDKLKGLRDDGRREDMRDRSVHNHVRVFIGHVEINGTERGELDRAFHEATVGADLGTDTPTQLRRPKRRARRLTDEEWVDQQVEMGRRHEEEMTRLVERTNRRRRLR
ncbi:MAG: hypothetical protein ACLQBX_00770 [Candidatus Limnocylindrales bacterium]